MAFWTGGRQVGEVSLKWGKLVTCVRGWPKSRTDGFRLLSSLVSCVYLVPVPHPASHWPLRFALRHSGAFAKFMCDWLRSPQLIPVVSAAMKFKVLFLFFSLPLWLSALISQSKEMSKESVNPPGFQMSLLWRRHSEMEGLHEFGLGCEWQLSKSFLAPSPVRVREVARWPSWGGNVCRSAELLCGIWPFMAHLSFTGFSSVSFRECRAWCYFGEKLKSSIWEDTLPLGGQDAGLRPDQRFCSGKRWRCQRTVTWHATCRPGGKVPLGRMLDRRWSREDPSARRGSVFRPQAPGGGAGGGAWGGASLYPLPGTAQKGYRCQTWRAPLFSHLFDFSSGFVLTNDPLGDRCVVSLLNRLSGISLATPLNSTPRFGRPSPRPNLILFLRSKRLGTAEVSIRRTHGHWVREIQISLLKHQGFIVPSSEKMLKSECVKLTSGWTSLAVGWLVQLSSLWLEIFR